MPIYGALAKYGGKKMNSRSYLENYLISSQFDEFLTEYEASEGEQRICPFYSFVLIHSMFKMLKSGKINEIEAKQQLCKLKTLFDGESNNIPITDGLEAWMADHIWFDINSNSGKPTIIDAYPFLLQNYDELKNDGDSKEKYCGFAIKDNSKGIFPLILYPEKTPRFIGSSNDRITAMISSIINILNNFDPVWKIISEHGEWTKQTQQRLYEAGIKRPNS